MEIIDPYFFLNFLLMEPSQCRQDAKGDNETGVETHKTIPLGSRGPGWLQSQTGNSWDRSDKHGPNRGLAPVGKRVKKTQTRLS
jgi:hypothetical protein